MPLVNVIHGYRNTFHRELARVQRLHRGKRMRLSKKCREGIIRRDRACFLAARDLAYAQLGRAAFARMVNFWLAARQLSFRQDEQRGVVQVAGADAQDEAAAVIRRSHAARRGAVGRQVAGVAIARAARRLR